MTKKFYAVKEGKSKGIFLNWEDCKAQVHGYPGAVYKSFPTLEEAKAFIGVSLEEIGEDSAEHLANTEGVIAYVDGSYKIETRQFSCGVVLFHRGEKITFAEAYDDSELAEMRNVAGELKGAIYAMQYCAERNISPVTIYHDYEGIAKWCTGEWQAKKTGTKAYRDFYLQLRRQGMDIRFVKVKGHSGDEYNEMADRLAKSVLGIQ